MRRYTYIVIVRYGPGLLHFGPMDPSANFILPSGDWLEPGIPGRLAVAIA